MSDVLHDEASEKVVEIPSPKSALDAAAVKAAYRRWAGVYDALFGSVSAFGRKRAVEAVNSLPGTRVLEVGVGTGLALPYYRANKHITGIDLSGDMLERARQRVRRLRLSNVDNLLEMDAEATQFADGTFDIAVAMFVASVVPHPRALLAELKRVVRRVGISCSSTTSWRRAVSGWRWNVAWRGRRIHWAGIRILPSNPCCRPPTCGARHSSPCRPPGCLPLLRWNVRQAPAPAPWWPERPGAGGQPCLSGRAEMTFARPPERPAGSFLCISRDI
ncbi:class I SAM-dependent methyltransferase [Komagataeibacter kakiaceti]|uniref:class I SAM-dependent methyltransferase n=1 Tax=Komagataeibacter kakiaceti TaxID=943261 RepID=UPI001F598633|nr:methyltransferase domain-containing protein [Komagataeibacter kakiaceti]